MTNYANKFIALLFEALRLRDVAQDKHISVWRHLVAALNWRKRNFQANVIVIFDFHQNVVALANCGRFGEFLKNVNRLFICRFKIQHLTDMFAVNSAVRVNQIKRRRIVRIDNSMLVRTENRVGNVIDKRDHSLVLAKAFFIIFTIRFIANFRQYFMQNNSYNT